MNRLTIIAFACTLMVCSRPHRALPDDVQPVSDDSSVALFAKTALIIRSKPSRNASATATLRPNEVVAFLGKTRSAETIDGIPSSWFYIKRSSGEIGYAFGGYLSAPPKSRFQSASRPVASQDVVAKVTFGKTTITVTSDSPGANPSSPAMVTLNHPGFSLSGPMYSFHEADALYLSYGITNGEGETSYLSKILLPDGTVQWSANVPGFNASQPFYAAGHAYVAAIGFVGKIDLQTGRYVWAHRNLYQKGRFNDFSDIFLVHSAAHFIEGTNHPKEEPRQRIEVNDTSGEKTIRNFK